MYKVYEYTLSNPQILSKQHARCLRELLAKNLIERFFQDTENKHAENFTTLMLLRMGRMSILLNVTS